VPFTEIGVHWPVIVNLLAGSLLGAYAGAEWATRLKTETLYRVIAVLPVIIARVLLLRTTPQRLPQPSPAGYRLLLGSSLAS
jgi:uncharacterized protein